ncbi:MAG: hypothetical protein AAB512_03055 [Patescibacteria group bacterium]
MAKNKTTRKSFQSYLILTSLKSFDKELNSLLTSLGIQSKNDLDTKLIEPQKNSISIAQIREINKDIYQKPVILPLKVIIIKQADLLTPEAQNALLKIYEEPPTHAIIILLATDTRHLLQTLLSRAVIIKNPNDEAREKVSSFLETSPIESLRELEGIQNPKEWLNEQITATYSLLVARIKAGKDTKSILQTLVLCSKAKIALDANVNPKFTLANLILNST